MYALRTLFVLLSLFALVLSVSASPHPKEGRQLKQAKLKRGVKRAPAPEPSFAKRAPEPVPSFAKRAPEPVPSFAKREPAPSARAVVPEKRAPAPSARAVA